MVATALAYLNSFANPFIFDDELIIVNNPDTRRLLPLDIAARWVVNLTFRLNYATGQLRVADYHLTNLAIHLAAALALFGVIRRTLMLPRSGAIWKDHGTFVAGTVAALWAVHPLLTQSITYICQRYEAMMGLCYLLTFYTFIRGVGAASPHGRSAWYGLSVALCLLGMGTKEVMATAPLVILLFDLLIAAPSPRAAWRERWLVHLGLWATLGVFALLEWRMFAVVGQSGKGVTLAVSPISYLLTQMQVIPHYLRLSIVPYPLCFDYAWPFVERWTEAALPGALLVGVGLLTAWLSVKRRPEAFIGVWFFCILAPTSSIVPVPDAAYEYRMYLPLAAVLTCAVLGGYRLLHRRISGEKASRVAVVMLVAVLVVTGVAMTHRRNQAYRSVLAVWEDVVRTRPQNLRARLNFSSALLREGRLADVQREARAVVEQLSHCSQLDAEDIPAWGGTAGEAELYRDARHYAIGHNYMGVACIQQGNPEAAEAHFAEAVRLLPQFKVASRNLRRVRRP